MQNETLCALLCSCNCIDYIAEVMSQVLEFNARITYIYAWIFGL